MRRPTKGPKKGSRSGNKMGPSSPTMKIDPGSKPMVAYSVPHGPTPSLARPPLRISDDRLPDNTHLVSCSGKVDAVTCQGAEVENVLPLLPLSGVERASGVSNKAVGERRSCNVFEFVLQSKEVTMCPACARSPRRANLPARDCPPTTQQPRDADNRRPWLDARSCLGLS
jgi:hypothetical protein